MASRSAAAAGPEMAEDGSVVQIELRTAWERRKVLHGYEAGSRGDAPQELPMGDRWAEPFEVPKDGTSFRLRRRRPDLRARAGCPQCRASGSETCPTCHGQGQVPVRDASGRARSNETCSRCDGRGEVKCE